MRYTLTFKRLVAIALIFAMLVSCTMEASGPGAPDQKIILSESARMIDRHLERVMRELEAEGELEGFSYQGKLDGEVVTRGLLTEEKGEEYLDFLYHTERFESVEEVISAASSLVDEKSLNEIVTEADKIEARLLELAEEETRALNETQKQEFYKDIRKLVVKSVVLLTAALVYALIPNTVFWGKITAATAVSIAAGIVASGFMRIIERKNSDSGAAGQTLQDWIKELTTEPTASWAIAAGIINTGKSMGYSPVTTSLILVVFGIYGIVDDLKPLLAKYNFKV